MTRHPTEGDGQLLTLGLLEQLRCECKGLRGASFDLAIFKKNEARSPRKMKRDHRGLAQKRN